ncbi:MAG TPA: acetylglutamate kinase [Clostridia bacterium]|nr:acetylglutamate kinase [Clostridia bacterium]
MYDPIEKASVLIEALPYMRKFFGKTFVIKYGGSAMTDPQRKKGVILDIILLKYIGINPILVHGGGPQLTEMLKRLGKKANFVNGLRVTDRETMEVAEMVLAGKVNKDIVALINQNGGKAVGISGKDGQTIMAKQADGNLGLVGEVTEIDTKLLKLLSNEGYIPVISSIGVGEDGETYNINADYVAGQVAAALQAEKLIILTDVRGVWLDKNDPDSFLPVLNRARAQELIEQNIIDGGMIPKVNACLQALDGGVASAHLLDGRPPHSLLLEIFTDGGVGTMITK